jgi:DNA (cytosine-5)-methyltransferase 1
MPAYYNENDKVAAAWLRALIALGEIPPGEVDERSIVAVRADDLRGFEQCHFFAGIGGWPLALRMAGWRDDRRVWTGSCPCQPFSGAGKRTGTADERHLWPEWRRLIADGRPAKLFGEQVASAAGRDWLAALRADLEGLGYAVGAADLCAAGIGAPQIRQRLYWMANADDAGLQGRERQGESDQAWEEWAAARREPLRPIGRPWPPRPGEVDRIPLLAYGLPGSVGGCKGYGNAIVPQVAAAFVMASEYA